MSGKKDFTKDMPIMAFMGKAVEENEELKTEVKKEALEEIATKQEEAPKNLKKIKGYVIDPRYRETKSQRVQMLIRPSTMTKIKKLAKKEKTSNNEIMNRILEEYFSNIGE